MTASLISENAIFVETGRNIVDIGVKERAKSLLQSVLKQLCGLECSQTIMYLEIRILLGIIRTKKPKIQSLLYDFISYYLQFC